MNTPRNHFLVSLILIYLASLVLLPVSDIKSKSEVPQVGEVAQQTVIAPVTFDIPKSPKQLQEEQSLAKEQVLLVFAHDKDRTEQLKSKFNKTMQTLNEYSIIQAKLQATDSETDLSLYPPTEHNYSVSSIPEFPKQLLQNYQGRNPFVRNYPGFIILSLMMVLAMFFSPAIRKKSTFIKNFTMSRI